MRSLIGLTGLAICSFAAATYFCGWLAGTCLGLFVVGIGLVVDSLKR